MILNESKHQTVYHISDTNMGKEVILKPSIPDNYFTKNGYEDAKTKRVCFSTSIDGCLRAMSRNLAGKNLYVYSPVSDIKLYKPKVLKVPDARVTGEVWSTCDTKVKLIGEIHVDEAKDDPIIYHYGIMSAALYDWEWRWVNKVKEHVITEGKLDNIKVAIAGNTYYVLAEREQSGESLSNDCVFVSTSATSAIKGHCQYAYRFRYGDRTIYYPSSKKSTASKKVYMYKFKAIKSSFNNIKDLTLITSGTLKSVCEEYNIELKENKDADGRKPTYDRFVAAAKEELSKSSAKLKAKVKFVKSNSDIGGEDSVIAADKQEWLDYYKDKVAILKGPNLNDDLIKEWNELGNRIWSNCYYKLPYPTAYKLLTLHEKDKFNNKIMVIEYVGFKEESVIEDESDIFMEASDEDLNPTWNPVDVKEVLDRTDPKKIYLTSDWHLFKNRFKKEHNYVNTQKIITWCRKNIKDNDVFMYLGDISYRWADEECQKESQKIMASIPGIKILILGNHDEMLGQEYYSGCGFDYVYEELEWNNLVFTHKPINMSGHPAKLNIHGHIHNMRTYNTTDGKANINVYPLYYHNKPVTLDYIMNHQEELMKYNVRSDWVGMGESAIIRETKRSELPNSAFGIPEDRKYPLDTEEHVRSAIKLFGHAEESKKKALAKRIKSAANSYNIEIPETTQVAKYLKEWAMASCNPVIGISKPFILKVGRECDGTINTKQFLLSPDIISDKYFAVNECGKIEIVDSDEVEDLNVEEYEYIGDPYRLNYIESAYKNESVVDPTFFYTVLSGKDMLSEDQIDFDPVFKKIDFGLIREKNLSNHATLEQEYHDILGDELSINESSIESIAVKPNKRYKNLVVREDVNGYYVYNNLNHKRTVSVSDSYMITETMYKSVL